MLFEHILKMEKGNQNYWMKFVNKTGWKKVAGALRNCDSKNRTKSARTKTRINNIRAFRVNKSFHRRNVSIRGGKKGKKIDDRAMCQDSANQSVACIGPTWLVCVHTALATEPHWNLLFNHQVIKKSKSRRMNGSAEVECRKTTRRLSFSTTSK